jgi:hypothetical protein
VGRIELDEEQRRSAGHGTFLRGFLVAVSAFFALFAVVKPDIALTLHEAPLR